MGNSCTLIDAAEALTRFCCENVHLEDSWMHDEIPPHRRSHVQEVRRWLEENVVDGSKAKVLQIADVRIEWEHFPAQLSGDFLIFVDGTRFPQRFRFGVNVTGQLAIYPPMFHSPLGAPASYAQIDLTEAAYAGLKNALVELLPPVRPLTREQSCSTPISERLPATFSVEDWQATLSNLHTPITIRL